MNKPPITTLIVDMSPVFYRWLMTATSKQSEALNLQKNEDGVYNLDEYRDAFVYKVMEFVTTFKTKFNPDDIVLAIDTKPYWRLKYWAGYKGNRNKDKKNGIDWDKARVVIDEMVNILEKYSSFKVIALKGAEGDDVGFVLSKELSERGHNVIVKSLDHDWVYNLEHKNVKYWETKHTVKTKDCGWVKFEKDEIDRLKFEHCMFGDRGDGLFPCTYYSRFTDEHIANFPNRTPLQMYQKRYLYDKKYKVKFGKSPYRNPPLGAKTLDKKLIKESITYEDFLDKDPIYRMNFDLNKKLGLPEGIPDDIREDIINLYDNANTTRDNSALVQYFTQYGLLDLISIIGRF